MLRDALVSRFRSGHMPSGLNVTSVIDNLSESEMDTCSDSEGECYGARHSPESSVQDDRVPNGSTKYNGFLNGRGGRHGIIYDDSSESITSSEVNSTPPRSNNGISGEKRPQSGVNASGISMQPNKETVEQGFQRQQQNKSHEDDIPNAPPLVGSYQQVNVVQEKLPPSRCCSPGVKPVGFRAHLENGDSLSIVFPPLFPIAIGDQKAHVSFQYQVFFNLNTCMYVHGIKGSLLM